MSSARPTALITGASAGIGAVFAARLAREGHDLVIVARRRERLDALAERLRAEAAAAVEVLVADLADPGGIGVLEQRLSKGDVDLLINNAGFPGYAPFVEVPTQTIEQLIHLHIAAVSRATRIALPFMVKRGGGAVINVASLLALSGTLPANPLPYRATYAGAKAYLVTFSQALASELKDTGVRVQVCVPGLVSTEFHNFLGPEGRKRFEGLSMTPEDVVQASLAALARDEVVCVPGLEDPAMVDKLGEAQRAVMSSANRSLLAARYRA